MFVVQLLQTVITVAKQNIITLFYMPDAAGSVTIDLFISYLSASE